MIVEEKERRLSATGAPAGEFSPPMTTPTIAIVGRPNVGKSTLFNRLVGYRKAIVDDRPGVTRDRNYAHFEWRGRRFLLVDTGGFEPTAQEGLLAQVGAQVQLAVEEADLILLLVSVRDGLNPLDAEIATTLRQRARKPLLLVLNKADTPRQEAASSEFLSLGFSRELVISAEQGRGLGELLDALYDALPCLPVDHEEGNRCRVAILGRPNVGKSSLLNRLLGEERAIVSSEPGTTRDPLDTPLTFRSRSYLFIDTAGIRRPSKVADTLERYSVLRAVKALERTDVALILLEATAPISAQDSKIASLAEEKGCSCLLLVNKWDRMPPGVRTQREFTLAIREKLQYLEHAPILFLSALTGKNAEQVLPAVERLTEERKRKVDTPALNRFLEEAVQAHQIPSFRGQHVKIYYATQFGLTPPTFLLFTNKPEGIPVAYRRYLIRRLRETFGFSGTPIRLLFRKR